LLKAGAFRPLRYLSSGLLELKLDIDVINEGIGEIDKLDRQLENLKHVLDNVAALVVLDLVLVLGEGPISRLGHVAQLDDLADVDDIVDRKVKL
jgi:hypothetical protein